MKLIWLLTALLAGMMAPVQAGFNGKMGRGIGDPVYAALISFCVGALGLLAYGLFLRMDFTAVRQAAGIEWWVWLAGLLGAFYVTSVIILTPGWARPSLSAWWWRASCSWPWHWTTSVFWACRYNPSPGSESWASR